MILYSLYVGCARTSLQLFAWNLRCNVPETGLQFTAAFGQSNLNLKVIEKESVTYWR